MNYLKLAGFFLLFFLSSLRAQEPTFRSISADDGLPRSECYAVRQDSKGYMWICTSAGLTKYNGRTFKTFTTADGLTDNTVFDTYEDEQGRLFYTTSNSRIGYIKNDSAFKLPVTDTLAKLLYSGRRFVKGIGSYDKELLLIATQDGFYTLDKKTLSKLTFITAPEDLMLWIKVIDGKAFCANYTSRGSYKKLSAKKDYTICIEANGKKTNASIDFDLIHISALAVFKTLYLSDGRLLVGFWDKVFTFYPDGSVDTLSIPARLLSLYEDHDHGVWITMYKNGLHYYPQGDLSAQPQHLLKGLSPTSVFMDREGGTWLSTEFDGVLYCSSLNIVAYPGEKNLSANIKSSSYISPYMIVNGTSPDIYLFRNRTDYRKIKIFTNDKIKVFIGDSIRGSSTYIRQGNYIYASGTEGTFLLDTTFKHIKTIGDTIFETSMLYNIVKGKDHCIWGVRFDDLLYVKNNMILYANKLPARGKDIGIDSAGTIYVATHDGLFIRDNGKLIAVKELSCKVNRLRCDPEGKMWACTDGMGLVCLDRTKILQRYNSSNGLVSDICYDVAFDEHHNCWAGTNNGLCRFDLLHPGKTQVYKTSQGLLSNEVLMLAFMKNELYISTQKGLCVMDVGQLQTNLVPPPVYIFSVINNGTPVGQKREFTARENNFTFLVDGISYRDPAGISYLYRLSGTDSTWKTNTTGEIILSNLDDGTYTLEVLAITSEGVKSKSPATYSFTIAPPFWKEPWFIILIIITTGGIVYGIIAWRIAVIRKREAEKTKLNKLIAEYQMSAIRAQMNPHFIFNAINSIQNYVLNNDTQYAYDYLTKFSKLIRKILDNSRHSTISLEKELDMLELYIQLEQRRFKNRFAYKIIIDKTIPVEEIKIPVMLIQPFVENAIWHGIMNMDTTSEGLLLVSMALHNEELKITIEDNGVGRKRSMEFKKHNSHESIGMLLSEKRLEILQTLGHKDSKIIVTDLYTEHSRASGTRVELFLPFKS
jgi:hypothetical protein